MITMEADAPWITLLARTTSIVVVSVGPHCAVNTCRPTLALPTEIGVLKVPAASATVVPTT
ncbi:MAG: hypothetical protein V7605_620 [Acidimicrobiaceae bacterium]